MLPGTTVEVADREAATAVRVAESAAELDGVTPRADVDTAVTLLLDCELDVSDPLLGLELGVEEEESGARLDAVEIAVPLRVLAEAVAVPVKVPVPVELTVAPLDAVAAVEEVTLMLDVAAGVLVPVTTLVAAAVAEMVVVTETEASREEVALTAAVTDEEAALEGEPLTEEDGRLVKDTVAERVRLLVLVARAEAVLETVGSEDSVADTVVVALNVGETGAVSDDDTDGEAVKETEEVAAEEGEGDVVAVSAPPALLVAVIVGEADGDGGWGTNMTHTSWLLDAAVANRVKPAPTDVAESKKVS